MSDADYQLYGFGLPVEDCTEIQLEHQIDSHKTQIRRGEVGTPNVYVRLAALERELRDR